MWSQSEYLCVRQVTNLDVKHYLKKFVTIYYNNLRL